MSMLVLVNGIPQEGRLELRLNEGGNYSIERVMMRPATEEKKAETLPPTQKVEGGAPNKEK